MTNEQRAALNEVLEYMWNDERNNYADNPESRDSHIFKSLVILENMLQRTCRTPAYYLTPSELTKETLI